MNTTREMKPTNGLTRRVLPAIFVLLVLLLSGCKDFSFYSELGVKSGIRISPSSVTILTGNTMSFSAAGGHAPYVFKVISGNGSIDADTGVYTAPGSVGNDIVMVTDKNNLSVTAQVRIVSTLDALQINPKVATLSPGGSITFVPAEASDRTPSAFRPTTPAGP